MYYIYGEEKVPKTTIVLKDEVYDYLVRKYGRRKMSRAVNEALMKELAKPHKSMFGVDPWLSTKGLRDEREPHETS